MSDFTQGGGTPTIRVFEWHSPGGSINGTLDLIAGSLTPQDCALVADDDPFCAIVNADTTASPWAFDPKFDDAGSFPPGHFYEGGIDLAFLGLEDECFSSVIFETRSSQSVDAVLKDFIAGGFENCGAHITIAPSGVNAVGGSHTFTVTVTQNIGGTETPVAGANPTVTLTAAGGAVVAAGKVDTCATTGTNAAGQCTVTFTSNSAGTVSGHAAVTVTLQGTPFSVETDGVAPNSGDALKRFVDANVSITPSGVNAVGSAHTFTVTSVASPAGTTPSLTSLTPSVSPATTLIDNTCGSPTISADGNTATCSFKINSSSVGTFTADATAVWGFTGTGTPSSATVTRSTSGTSGPGGSGSATKRFVDANIAITPASATNAVGTNHVLTITVNALNGMIDAGSHTATATIVSGPGSFVGGNTPAPTPAAPQPLLHRHDHLGSHRDDGRLGDAPRSRSTAKPITRTTGTAANTTAGGSGNA